MLANLNPDKALIFRIVHRENVPRAIKRGLYSRNSAAAKHKYVEIGNTELIEKRRHREVGCAPWGTLSDYVPFYFTPFSPMLYNIKTGYNGIQKRPNPDIIIFVSSLHKLRKLDVPFIFTDRHAYLKFARFTSDLKNLDWIDWEILQKRDFKKDDVDKFDRYQAEALVHNHVPTGALLGVVCYNNEVRDEVTAIAGENEVKVKVISQPGWYFT
jgi:hypothetical protein